MPAQQRNRNIKSIEFENYLLSELLKLVGNGKEFNTLSGLVIHASTEFIVKYKLEKENENALEILIKILETPEGKVIFDKVIKKNSINDLSTIIEKGTIEDEDVEI